METENRPRRGECARRRRYNVGRENESSSPTNQPSDVRCNASQRNASTSTHSLPLGTTGFWLCPPVPSASNTPSFQGAPKRACFHPTGPLSVAKFVPSCSVTADPVRRQARRARNAKCALRNVTLCPLAAVASAMPMLTPCPFPAAILVANGMVAPCGLSVLACPRQRPRRTNGRSERQRAAEGGRGWVPAGGRREMACHSLHHKRIRRALMECRRATVTGIIDVTRLFMCGVAPCR